MKDFHNTSIIDLAAIVAEHLTQHGIEVVLVGGLAVEIYTENLYLTKDIDMVNINYQKPARMHSAMAELGFKKQGRVYVNSTTDITVEFPTGPLSVGNELIQHTTVTKVASGLIPILCVEDIIKDRIAAFIHWKDKQSLIQALAIILKHKIKPTVFQDFCSNENGMMQYELLKKLHASAKKQKAYSMEQLENLLTKILISQL